MISQAEPRERATRPLHHVVHNRVLQTPGAAAVTCGDQSVSYLDLDRRASALALALRAIDIRAGDVVAVALPRSVDLVVAMYAVLKAGGTVLALDQRWPAVRREQAVAEAGAVALLGCDVTIDDVPTLGTEDWPTPTGAAEPGVWAPNDCPAYAVFTSGSTGRPKGVVVTHGGVTNLVGWHAGRFGVGTGTRVGSVASIGFDAFHWDVWSTLSAGATLVLAPDSTALVAGAVAAWFCAEQIDIGFVPTALAAQVCRDLEARGARTRAVLTGGDRLLLDPHEVPVGVTLFNAYGPSECAVVATCAEVRPAFLRDRDASIGGAIDGTDIYLLDEDLRPVPPGTRGQLYIGGAGVGAGYLRQPAATADRFVPNPFGDGRLFCTGDFAVAADGHLWFHGRGDRQIQVNGVRVELGEVEFALRATGLVSDCRVDLVDNPHTGRAVLRARCLVADRDIEAEAVRSAARTSLPTAMVPSIVETARSAPLTTSDKVNWDAFVADGNSTQPAPQPTDDDWLTGLVSSTWLLHLKLTDPPMADDDFFSLGGDSLAALELITHLENKLGRELTFDLVFQHPVFQDFVHAVRQTEPAA